jgi:integrase
LSPAKSRRAYGSGSVWQRSDGRWYGVIEAGYTTTGGRRRVTVSAKTEAECKRRLREKQRQIAAEGVSDTSARTTVKAWSETWLEITQRTLRPKPWATDRSAVRQWIVPTIGHKRLEQLTPADVRAVANAQRAAGRSTSTARRTHTTLTAMLRAALLEGHQVPRRVLDVEAPAIAANDRTDMTIPEALAVLQVASFLPHGSRWAMAFLHGMRQGECLGLTWDRVDLDAGLITVAWELQQVPYVDRADPSRGFRLPDGLPAIHLVDSFHLLPPKTKRGFRVVPLVPAMREALADWKAIAPESPYGLVWPTIDGRPANEKHDRDEWQALQGTAAIGHPAGRYYHPHEARHTTATAMLEEGIDPHQATAIMGHSSILTTRGYQHPSQTAALKAMEAIASRFELGSS